MFIFHIYNSFDTEGNCGDKGGFFILKTSIPLNSGKIKMGKLV